MAPTAPSFATGWVDWNLLLNHEGGPNHLGNLCDAPVLTTEKWDGLIYQPYYHVLGHFSKFIVPGSVRVSTSVTADFSDSLGKASSGMNVGASITSWDCDSSVRQSFTITKDGGLMLLQGAGHPTDGDLGHSDSPQDAADGWSPGRRRMDTDAAAEGETKPVELCMGRQHDPIVGSISLVDCAAKEWIGQWGVHPDGGMLVSTHTASLGLCLAVPHAYATIMPHGGAALTLADCGSSFDHTFFYYNANANTVTAGADYGRRCVTAGWAFVQSMAAVTPSGDTVVVVLNEAEEDVDLKVRTGANQGSRTLAAKLPARSIQTYVY